MREFDFEAARSGEPVQTRDGKQVRIICWDAKNWDYPLVALVMTDEEECIGTYTAEGKISSVRVNDFDLVMAPVRHVKYVPLYRTINDSFATGMMYDTEEEAERYGREVHRENFIKAVKIEWEEE